MLLNTKYQKDYEKIRAYSFKGKEPGTHLLILGGVHGNESCGQHALSLIKEKLESGALHIHKGMLTIVPQANPWACAASTRYLERNLNRVIRHHKEPKAYEERIAAQITALIDVCDVMIDIHSVSTYCPKPFVFNDNPTPESNELCQSLGVGFVVKNWLDMLSEHTTHEFDTTQSYANTHGKLGCVIECGQHQDKNSTDFALLAVHNAMKLYGLIAGDMEIPEFKGEILAQKAFIKKREGQMVSDEWHHLMPVKKATVIARYDDGEELAAPDDGYLLLPAHYANIGDEWFYFGRLGTA